MRETEMSMVRRMLEGDEEAFEWFSDVFIPRLQRFALNRLGHDRELAKEIVQRTLVKVIDKLDTFRGEAALMTWLGACCRAEIALYFRRRGRGGVTVELDDEPAPVTSTWSAPPPEGPEASFLRGEAAELVHEALDQLPAHYGRALEWKYLDDLTVREIAGRLEIGPKAAESLLTRARNAFREVYARLVAGTGDSVAFEGRRES